MQTWLQGMMMRSVCRVGCGEVARWCCAYLFRPGCCSTALLGALVLLHEAGKLLKEDRVVLLAAVAQSHQAHLHSMAQHNTARHGAAHYSTPKAQACLFNDCMRGDASGDGVETLCII